MGRGSLKFDKRGVCYKCGRPVSRLESGTWHHDDIQDYHNCGFVKVKRDVKKLLKSKEEIINILEYFETKKNYNSPAGKHDERPWNFCKLCGFNSLQGCGRLGGIANQSIKMHLIKKHNIRLSESKWIKNDGENR